MKNSKKKLAAKGGSATTALRLDPIFLGGLNEIPSKLTPPVLRCLEATVVAQQQQGLKDISPMANEMTAEELAEEPIAVVVRLFLAVLFHPDATHPLRRQVMQLLSSLPAPFRDRTVVSLAEVFADSENGDDADVGCIDIAAASAASAAPAYAVDAASAVSLCLQHDFDLGVAAVLSRADRVCASLSAQLGDLLSKLGDGSGEDQAATKKLLLIFKSLSVVLMRDRRPAVTAETKDGKTVKVGTIIIDRSLTIIYRHHSA